MVNHVANGIGAGIGVLRFVYVRGRCVCLTSRGESATVAMFLSLFASGNGNYGGLLAGELFARGWDRRPSV